MSKDSDTSLIDSFPFAFHLNSNYIPLDSEVLQIKDFLIQPRKQLEEVKAEMDRLQAELDSVKSKYNSLYRQFSSCTSLITLARRVPDDVLQEIFYQTLPTDRNALLDINAAPLILTRICRQWRRVAFASPRLWSTIHIHIKPRPYEGGWRDHSWDPPLHEPPPERWEELRAIAASDWLKRSGNFPLHLSFVAQWEEHTRWDESYFPPVVDPYLSLMVPFSSRWNSLVLQGHEVSFTRIFTLQAADLQSLELLILDFDHEGYSAEEFDTDWSKCGILTSSSLRKFSIRRYGSMRHWDLHINWSQLTHLELCAPSGGDRGMILDMATASKILQVATQLVSCGIMIRGREDPSNINSMQLPLLRHLSIIIRGHIFPFTDKLEVPALQQINLHIIEAFPRQTIDYKTCLAPLFRPQQGRVQKLVIDTKDLDHETFLDILRKCPDLISLTITRSSGYSNPPGGDTPPITIDDEFLRLFCRLLRDWHDRVRQAKAGWQYSQPREIKDGRPQST